MLVRLDSLKKVAEREVEGLADRDFSFRQPFREIVYTIQLGFGNVCRLFRDWSEIYAVLKN